MLKKGKNLLIFNLLIPSQKKKKKSAKKVEDWYKNQFLQIYFFTFPYNFHFILFFWLFSHFLSLILHEKKEIKTSLTHTSWTRTKQRMTNTSVNALLVAIVRASNIQQLKEQRERGMWCFVMISEMPLYRGN